MKQKPILDDISDAIQAVKDGKIIIVVDNQNRENEGDFVCAASKATPDIVNFMATHGKGLICAALEDKRCDDLDLDLMVDKNTAVHETPFTVSVDLKGHGCTTGISAHDRAKTLQALANPNTKPLDLARPGHIFPLRAKPEGVLRRAGHTEAAVDFAKLSQLYPAGVLVEIMKKDGTMARLPDLRKMADKWQLKLVSIEDLISYRLRHESQIICISQNIHLPTRFGNFRLQAFKQKYTNEKHMALVKGQWQTNEAIPVRVHSSCLTGDVFASNRCDCGEQLHKAMQIVEQQGKGIIVYMQQEGRGIGLENKLKAYALQEKGMDTVEANKHLGFKDDERDYGIGAQILRALNVSKMKLISNNPAKRVGLKAYGLEVVETIPLNVKANPHNTKYLKTKRDKMGHQIPKNI